METMIARNSALMDGVIICPKCQHNFFVDGDASVDDVRKTLISLRTEMEEKKTEAKKLVEEFDLIDEKCEAKSEEVNAIVKKAKNRTNALEEEYRALRTLSSEVDNAESNVNNLRKKLVASENEFDRLSGKIEVMRNRLFGEITSILEGRIMNGKAI